MWEVVGGAIIGAPVEGDPEPRGDDHHDFVAIAAQDAERSRAFYVDTLGLRPDDRARMEVWAGQTCFGIWTPERLGRFSIRKNGHPALQVADVPAARAAGSKGRPIRG